MLKVITKIRTLFFPFNLFVDEVSQGANSMMWSSSSGPGGGEGSGSFLSGGLAVKEGITSHAKQEIQRLKGRGRMVQVFKGIPEGCALENSPGVEGAVVKFC